MKFDLAYCLSLDDKLSIYDMRDLNFDETMEFDSATAPPVTPYAPNLLLLRGQAEVSSSL